MPSNKINILVVDDHFLVRSGIISLLKSSTDFNIIGEATTGKEAIHMTTTLFPDVVLLDISLSDMTGIDVMKATRNSTNPHRPEFLIVTMFDSEEYYFRAIKAGALGLINKNITRSTLFTGIKKVYNGELYFGDEKSVAEISKIIARCDKKGFHYKDPENIILTNREKEVLYFIYRGLQNKQIALELGIGERTVETYRANLMQKFEAKSFAELTLMINASEKLKKIVGARS